MDSLARTLKSEEYADYSVDNYPINEESRRIRVESMDGTLVLEDNQVITYSGGLAIGYRRPGGIYTEPEGGELIAPEPIPRLPGSAVESKD